MTFDTFWPILYALLLPLGIWWVQRAVHRGDKDNEERDRHLTEMQDQIHRLELKIAGDLPTKEDMEAVRSMLTEVRDMVLRMDERGKAK